MSTISSVTVLYFLSKISFILDSNCYKQTLSPSQKSKVIDVLTAQALLCSVQCNVQCKIATKYGCILRSKRPSYRRLAFLVLNGRSVCFSATCIQ